MEMINTKLENNIIKLFRQNNVIFAAIFGSRAKGTATPNSDYDFLIEFAPTFQIPLSRYLPFKSNLEKVVNNNIDIVTTRGLGQKQFKREVLKTMKVIYDERKR
ncbi:MAG: hypothetical protein CEN91_459 [Candidatus Berkelbacteria bacterium Licking1014_85]|uniref:Polymerase beta nucleotidyltransferase domain-containing protein n=1 Tax=Candidatus Berkelbacteria bacterium Licking1014_85 TaxID=2017148 RepID=A0A554LHR2_9BACT|nr:MAG: hypothetical protein CEN91_459 [Candidatus Berkelbacteria bacterium Licking1014_85]